MITAPLQSFLFMLVKLASDIAMLILLIRYLAGSYLYIDSGSILQSINQVAMVLSRPFRPVVYWIGFRRRDVSPLVAIGAVLVVRGLLFALIPVSFGTFQWTAAVLLFGQRESFSLGALSGLRLLALVLFFSVMFARAGGFYGGLFFRTVDDIAATVFGHVRRVLRLKNLWVLLAFGLVYISLLYGLVRCLILWDVRLPYYAADGMLEALMILFWAMILLTFIFIAISWISLFARPNESNRAWLFLQAMVMPALEQTRRLVPWMRIGMLDLSPLLFFLAMWFAIALLHVLQALLESSVAGPPGLML